MSERAFGIRRFGNLARWDDIDADAMAEDEARNITRQLLARGESLGKLEEATDALDSALRALLSEPCSQGGARSGRRMTRG